MISIRVRNDFCTFCLFKSHQQKVDLIFCLQNYLVLRKLLVRRARREINEFSILCSSHTEIFSKRRKIYPICVKNLSCHFHFQFSNPKKSILNLLSTNFTVLLEVWSIFNSKVIWMNIFISTYIFSFISNLW